MEYNIRALEGASTFVLVTLDQVRAVAKLDSQTLSTRREAFVEDNTFTYYLVINTWGHQIIQFASEEAWAYIWMRIQQCGLVPVIRDTSALADLIIHGESPEWDYTYGYLSVLSNRDFKVFDPSLVDLLRILRYPKRFSPEHADVIRQESLLAFLDVNKRCKGFNVAHESAFWVSRIRIRIADMLKGFSWDITDGYFSSGTTATTDKSLLSKLRNYAKAKANLGDCPLYALSSAVYAPERWRNTLRLRSAVKVQAVPKSYKAARIIAKEHPVSAFGLQAVAKGIRDAFRANGYERYVDLKDQTWNQDLSEAGSVDGSYATIDLSNASDTICESFARSVLPKDVLDAVDEYRCAYLDLGAERRISQIFATSGSPVTFIIESLIFCAIALEVGLSAHNLTGWRIKPPRVYGDDMVVDDRICDYLCQVLERCGFMPNLSKTFSGKSPLGYYRESCGEEWLNGYPMHSSYYPRAVIKLDAEGIAATCDLQHKFFDSWKLRLFLVDTIKRVEPRMTAHYYGEICDDLWDLIPTGKECTRGVSCDDPSFRRKYLGLMTKYQKSTLAKPDEDLLQVWYYYSYLKLGRAIDPDPLFELLRISNSRCRYVADSCQAVSVWGWRVE